MITIDLEEFKPLARRIVNRMFPLETEGERENKVNELVLSIAQVRLIKEIMTTARKLNMPDFEEFAQSKLKE